MLDLTQLATQMENIGQYLHAESAAARRRLEKAQQVLWEALPRQSALVERQQVWRDRLGFTAAEPIEPLDTCGAIAAAPPQHTVLATDGSQIAPSHHEIAYCYLINVGRVVLHYGQNRHPLLDSLPEVFYRPEDLYVSRQWGIRTEEWMGYQRTVSEAVVLAELAAQALPLPHPTLAMVDGSLIHWFLEPLPGEARDRLLPPLLQSWDTLRQARIPLVGYLSASRSGEALNMLRLQTCPHPQPDCLTHCPGQTEQAPCQVFAPLRDTALWAVLLKPGQRSPLWRSSAKILTQYGDHAIYFCYIHVGTEIARLEFPQWVVQDATLLDTALTLAVEQVQKGYGYPVALAEAHNQAVVRGGDRLRFFSLLEQQMIRAGLRNIGTSYKEARKRGSIA
ncbi:MAG: DNA double-strand break repair nuclease NurA [Synechococcales bacterium]|nr:DNA double-strand break repair nuclease NurA [Synechococcales bacterium]